MNRPTPENRRTAVERIADAVRDCPAVADLHGGPFGTVATLLPRRRVVGVLVDGEPDAVTAAEVHVVGRWPHPVTEVAAQVRTAVRGVVPDVDVEVTVEDYR